jgi:Na+/melibiose symporter-like transporter
MSVTPDPEWRDLMQDWQSEAPEEVAPAPLSDEVRRRIRSRVRWQSFRLILNAASQGALAVGMVVFMASFLDLRQPIHLTAMIGTLFLSAAGMIFGFWNYRGTWWPAAESTTTFVDLSLERCRRKLRTVRFCYQFLAVELAFMVPWATWALLSRADPWTPGPWAFMFGWMALVSVAVVLWASWYRKRTLRELAEWEELRRSLGE